jgi:serine/threonine protein kinase
VSPNAFRHQIRHWLRRAESTRVLARGVWVFMSTSLGKYSLLRSVPVVEGFKVLDPCVLYDRIGQGGMGVVYRARHLQLDIDVAVKCLKNHELTEELNERFQREARAAAVLDHANLIRVYGVDCKHGLNYLVMGFVSGESARDRVDCKGPLGADESLAIVFKAATGVAFAHEKGVIHRDIKPENILVSTDGEVKVADLGLAKIVESQTKTTETQVVAGTPPYMPPEQWRGLVSPRIDVYALGATLYYLLTGRRPVTGKDPGGAHADGFRT